MHLSSFWRLSIKDYWWSNHAHLSGKVTCLGWLCLHLSSRLPKHRHGWQHIGRQVRVDMGGLRLTVRQDTAFFFVGPDVGARRQVLLFLAIFLSVLFITSLLRSIFLAARPVRSSLIVDAFILILDHPIILSPSSSMFPITSVHGLGLLIDSGHSKFFIWSPLIELANWLVIRGCRSDLIFSFEISHLVAGRIEIGILGALLVLLL